MHIKLQSPISAVWSVSDCTDPTHPVQSNFITCGQVDGERETSELSYRFAPNTTVGIQAYMDWALKASPGTMDSTSKTF